jgi:hypothetical protein
MTRELQKIKHCLIYEKVSNSLHVMPLSLNIAASSVTATGQGHYSNPFMNTANDTSFFIYTAHSSPITNYC